MVLASKLQHSTTVWSAGQAPSGVPEPAVGAAFLAQPVVKQIITIIMPMRIRSYCMFKSTIICMYVCIRTQSESESEKHIEGLYITTQSKTFWLL